ncbi:MAG: arginine--tRNA ligase [Anaerolineales bacterium]
MSLPEGAMSSRRGRVVLFKEVYDEAIKRVLAVESERSVNIPENERVKIAEQIGLGALVYSMLAVDNNKDIVFDINEALSFDGRTGPYIQNAHVRANSILRKAREAGYELRDTRYEFGYELTKHAGRTYRADLAIPRQSATSRERVSSVGDGAVRV